MPQLNNFRAWQAKLAEPSLSILFTLQFVIVFLIAPIDITSSGHLWVTETALALMSIIFFLVVVEPLARTLTLFSVVLSFAGIIMGPGFAQHHLAQPITTLSALLYALTFSMVVGRKIFNEGPVTGHRICGAITIYLNIAICFALVDSLLAGSIPNAFSFPDKTSEADFGTFIYFSLTTLTSTGYGDIVPIHPYARSLASLESVVGEFYLGGLIATLISLHVTYRQSNNAKA